MDIKKTLHHCRFLLTEKRYEEAIEADRLLQVSPNLFDAWFLRGNALQDSKRFHEALESYNTAKDINSHSFYLLYSIGIVLCVLKRYEAAREALENAIKMNSTRMDPWNHLGIVLYKPSRI